MAEPYQAEFAALSQGETQDTPQPAKEADTKSVEEFLELPVGDQKYKIPLNVEVPFKHAGTMTKVPFSQLLNNYRQGAHLETKMQEYKRMKEEAEKLRGDTDSYNQLRQKYEAIQKWSEENPDQWERLYELWQNRDKAFTSPQTEESKILASELQALKAELKGFKDFKTTYEKQQEEARIQQDMAEVQKEIDQFSKDWSEIDLAEKDEEGIPLKSRIISFGVQHQIPDFESAALKYLKPRLMEVVSTRARNEVVKGVKSDKQQGIVSRGNTPQGKVAEVDPRKLSWSELGDLARAEYKP